MKQEWIEHFGAIGEVIKEKSKDQSFKCAAVIVTPENEIVSTGYNSFPKGINDDIQDRQEKPIKYEWIEHAERNAIYNAAKIGSSTNGCYMILTADGPCTNCARGIINSGIKRIYCKKTKVLNQDRWADNLKISVEMLEEAGVEVIYY